MHRPGGPGGGVVIYTMNSKNDNAAVGNQTVDVAGAAQSFHADGVAERRADKRFKLRRRAPRHFPFADQTSQCPQNLIGYPIMGADAFPVTPDQRS